MTKLKDWISQCIREYNQQLDALDKEECIDSESYKKQLYWNRGFLKGCVHTLKRVGRVIDIMDI